MKKVRALSQSVGVSQKDLALNMGLKPSQLNLYFNDRAEMKASRFVELLELLGIDIDHLLEERLHRLRENSETIIDDSNLYTKLGRLRGAKRKSLQKIICILGA